MRDGGGRCGEGGFERRGGGRGNAGAFEFFGWGFGERWEGGRMNGMGVTSLSLWSEEECDDAIVHSVVAHIETFVNNSYP